MTKKKSEVDKVNDRNMFLPETKLKYTNGVRILKETPLFFLMTV